MRYLNITQISTVFDMSRPTVISKLKKAKLQPSKKGDRQVDLYDMAKVGPALFGNKIYA